MLDWMKHKLESRFRGSTYQLQICRWHHPNGRKRRGNKEPLDESERGEWKAGLKLSILGEGNGNPLQYSCLENPRNGGAWWAAVYGITQSQTWPSNFIFIFHLHALEKEMATHSSILAWRIPGAGEPGGLPSMGSLRVGHDWSNLAAAAGSFSDTDIFSCDYFERVWVKVTSQGWLLDQLPGFEFWS